MQCTAGHVSPHRPASAFHSPEGRRAKVPKALSFRTRGSLTHRFFPAYKKRAREHTTCWPPVYSSIAIPTNFSRVLNPIANLLG